MLFFGLGSFGCFGGYFNLVYGFEEVLADCSHGELGVSFGLPKVSGAVQAKKPFLRAKALLRMFRDYNASSVGSLTPSTISRFRSLLIPTE